MVKNLKNISAISSGQTFRSKVENNPNGDVWVIQMKDLNESYTDLGSAPNLVVRTEVSNQQLLSKGDILFLAKGNNTKAFVYNKEHLAVAVSLFFIIKVDRTVLDPSYLAWFLNNTETQLILRSSQEGSTVSSIKKSILENLVIPLPNLAAQQKMATIYSLHTKAQDLEKKLIAKREKLINAFLIQLTR